MVDYYWSLPAEPVPPPPPPRRPRRRLGDRRRVIGLGLASLLWASGRETKDAERPARARRR